MADLSDLSSIIHLSYSLISGPAGHARDWARFRSLYYPGARLMPVIGGESPHVRQLSVEDYIRRVEPIFVSESFYERETSREEHRMGRIAHVLSHYESLRDPNSEPFEHGTNSMQLFFDDHRWWFITTMWNTSRSA